MCDKNHGKTYKYWLRRDSRHMIDAIMIGQTVYERLKPQPCIAHEDAARARVALLNSGEAA